jgi:predicted O-methyltransferase YrrM
MDYMTATFVREPGYLAAMRAEGERRRAGMQVSPYEGAMLAWLVRISGAARILEVGTFMGYSTLWMASALPAGGHITTLENSVAHAAQAQAHFDASPHAAQISLVTSAAGDWFAAQQNAPAFDLVFIDADKANYAHYLEAALPLLAPRGWIIGDNTLLFGALSGVGGAQVKPASVAAMQQFNATLADAARFESIMLPTLEGMTVARLKA